MLAISFIYGLSLGLEYFNSELSGFGINLDLGFIRFTYYTDYDGSEDEE